MAPPPVLSGETAAGHVAAGHVAAGETAAGHVAAGHVAAGETAAGHVAAGEIAHSSARRVGVLALQGGFEAHAKVVRELGHEPVEVRVPADLEGLDALILPGGESTVMTLGVQREGLAGPLRELVAAGTPVLGTCAGMIMLDRDHLGVLDIVTRRNAFGRQLRSFEADLDIAEVAGGPVHAVFIRAPWVAEHGPRVEILASVDEHPVAIRQGNVLALSFHPELTGERRLHELLLAMSEASGGGCAQAQARVRSA